MGIIKRTIELNLRSEGERMAKDQMIGLVVSGSGKMHLKNCEK